MWKIVVQQALKNPPINLSAWIEANKATLKPPIGNRQFWKGDWQNLLVMMVGGPNYRPDYHDDPGEELFIQLHGDLTLNLIDPVTRNAVRWSCGKGRCISCPRTCGIPRSGPEGCIGLVIERYRQPGEVDALEWYDEAGNLEFRGEFLVENIEEDLAKVQAAWAEWVKKNDRRIPTVWRVGEDNTVA